MIIANIHDKSMSFQFMEFFSVLESKDYVDDCHSPIGNQMNTYMCQGLKKIGVFFWEYCLDSFKMTETCGFLSNTVFKKNPPCTNLYNTTAARNMSLLIV